MSTSTQRRPGLPARLLLIAVIGVGLVGMHHLVAVACHHSGAGAAAAASDHTLHHMLPSSDPLRAAPASSAEPMIAPSSPAVPSDGHGIVGAAAMCLAILLMIIGLVLPRRRAWFERAVARHRWREGLAAVSRCLKPPDLTLLSISRT